MKYFALSIFLIFPCVVQSFCLENFYGSASGGVNLKPRTVIKKQIKVKYRPGYLVAGSLGYKWNSFRIEGEYAYRHNQFKHFKFADFLLLTEGHYRASSALVNGYFDFKIPNCFNIQPYLGVGVGYAKSKVKLKRHQHGRFFGNKNGFAWQALAGFTCPFKSNFDISFEYRYFKTKSKNDDNHSIGTNLRYWF